MVECVSRKIQSKEMDKSFPFPGRKILKEDENKNVRVFPLRTGQISQFPFRRLPWNNNVALNGFVIYSNSCLFLFGNPFYLPQMSQPNVRMPQRSEYKQMLANLFKCNEMDVNEAWMNICWNQFAGKGLISETVVQAIFCFLFVFKKKTSVPEVGVTMVEARPLMPGLVPEWAIVGRPVICCGRKYCCFFGENIHFVLDC